MKRNSRLSRKRIKVIVTAGPTRAYLDDVRYISNYSTGELGFILCEMLIEKGFEVHGVIGPTQFNFEKLKMKSVATVETADEMHRAALRVAKRVKPEWGVFTAAVLDFAPKRRRSGKVSSRGVWNIALAPTRKIIDDVSRVSPGMRKIGFKLETRPLRGKPLAEFAKKLISEKKLSGVCVNFLPQISKRFHHAFLFDGEKGTHLRTKREIVRWICQRIEHP